MSAALTDAQRKVLLYIRRYRAECQMPPTRLEITEHFGWKSPNAAQEFLEALQKKGEIKIAVGKSRGIFDMQVSK